MYVKIEGKTLIQKELENYSNSINVPLKLFKGITYTEKLPDCYIVKPTESLRESKTKNEYGNAYNLLLNNLKSWDDFPKRQKSLIVTSSFQTAKSFSSISPISNSIDGKLYHVFPEYNSIIAVAPESDIWISFKNGMSELGLKGNIKNLKKFNSFLKEIFDLIDGYENFDQTWEVFIESITALSKKTIVPKTNTMSLEAECILNSLIKNEATLITFLESVFDLSKNNFITEVFNDKLKNKFYDNEIWTEGNCLLIEHEFFKTLGY